MNKRKQIQLIHIAKHQLRIDDDTYRTMLRAISGEPVTSSTQLSAAGLEKILRHLKKQGFKTRSAGGRPTPSAKKDRMIRKIQAQLISMGNLPDSYADGIADHMFSIHRYHWCNEQQLHKIIAALTYQQRRQNADME